MILEVTTRRATEVAADSLGILLCQTKRLPRFVQPVDAAVDGMIRRLLETEEFRGKRGEVFSMPAPIIFSRNGKTIMVQYWLLDTLYACRGQSPNTLS